jgi:hypothetical protein
MLTVYLDFQGVLQSLNAEKEYKKTGEQSGLTFFNSNLFIENEKLKLIRDFCKKNKAQVVIISSATAPYSVSYDVLEKSLNLPLVEKSIQEDYYKYSVSRLKGISVDEHSKKYNFENYIVFDDQWKKHFDGYWRKCVRKIDPKEGIDDRSIQNAERILEKNSKKIKLD